MGTPDGYALGPRPRAGPNAGPPTPIATPWVTENPARCLIFWANSSWILTWPYVATCSRATSTACLNLCIKTCSKTAICAAPRIFYFNATTSTMFWEVTFAGIAVFPSPGCCSFVWTVFVCLSAIRATSLARRRCFKADIFYYNCSRTESNVVISASDSCLCNAWISNKSCVSSGWFSVGRLAAATFNASFSFANFDNAYFSAPGGGGGGPFGGPPEPAASIF